MRISRRRIYRILNSRSQSQKNPRRVRKEREGGLERLGRREEEILGNRHLRPAVVLSIEAKIPIRQLHTLQMKRRGYFNLVVIR